MFLKLHIITTKLKRAFIALASVLLALILVILPINFTVSALDDTTYNGSVVNLPFSSPQSFGNAPAVIFYNEMRSRYEYFVFDITRNSSANDSSVYIRMNFTAPPSGFSSSDYFGGYSFSFGLSKSEIDATITLEEYPTATIQVYWFSWYPNQTTYSFQKVKQISVGGSQNLIGNYTPSLAEGSYFSYNSLVNYNSLEVSGFSSASRRNYVYVFQGSDGQGVMINRLNDIVGYNHEIVFYLNEILNKLGQGSDYTPSQTTTNQHMSDYEQAEGALMDDNIQKLNDLSLPDLGNFNSGQQGNAFQFISSNIEFFSGMNGNGSIAKVGTVLVVILGLGLTSFIIGLTNRRKG